MNLQQLRTQFIRQTGHYNLVGTKVVGTETLPDFSVDAGADYYINKAIRTLEGRVKIRENFRLFRLALTPGATSGYIPGLKSIKHGHHIVAGVSKPLQLTSMEYLEEVSLTEGMAEECVYPLVAISDGTVAAVVPDSYLLYGGWYVASSWDGDLGELILKPLSEVLPIEGLWQLDTLPTFTPKRTYNVEEGSSLFSLLGTLLLDGALFYIFPGEAGMHTISLEVTGDFEGLLCAPITLIRTGEPLHYASLDDFTDNLALIANDTPSGAYTIPSVCNALIFFPSVEDWSDESILSSTVSFKAFETLDEVEVEVEEVIPANVYIYPPAAVASTLSLYGWVYAAPLENNLDANWWSTKHYNVVIDQAAIELNAGLLNRDVIILMDTVERSIRSIISDDISTEVEMLGGRFV